MERQRAGARSLRHSFTGSLGAEESAARLGLFDTGSSQGLGAHQSDVEGSLRYPTQVLRGI